MFYDNFNHHQIHNFFKKVIKYLLAVIIVSKLILNFLYQIYTGDGDYNCQDIIIFFKRFIYLILHLLALSKRLLV